MGALATDEDPRGRRLLVQLLEPLINDANATSDHLLARLGTVQRILVTDPETLVTLGVEQSAIRQIALIRALLRHVLRAPLLERPLVGDLTAARDYLSSEIGHASTETLHVLFLDGGNRLIDELVQCGEVDHVHISIRMIVQRALIAGAAGLILAHNHPSGDNASSRADRDVTRTLARALSALNIKLFDHLIIAGPEVRSLRAEGVI